MKKTKGTNPKDLLARKKVPMRLIPPASLIQQTIALNLGITKGYGEGNWRETKVLMSVYLEAIYRHMLLLMDGEDIDEESLGCHESSIAANCSILMDARLNGTLVDDRQKTGKVKELMKQTEALLIKQRELFESKKKR